MKIYGMYYLNFPKSVLIRIEHFGEKIKEI